jgi:maltose O-acetyltransferase
MRSVRGLPDLDRLVADGLRIGRDVFVGQWTVIDPTHCWLISIGDETTIAPRCYILAHDASTKRAHGVTKVGLVDIGRRVFVGGGSIVLPGVTIGDDAIVGAGSVVRSDVPPGELVVGNPATAVGKAADYLEREAVRIAGRPRWGDGWTAASGITPERKAQMREALRDGPGYAP